MKHTISTNRALEYCRETDLLVMRLSGGGHLCLNRTARATIWASGGAYFIEGHGESK